MTSAKKPRINLYGPESVSREGFRIEDAASVAMKNCLKERVHSTQM